MGNSIIVKWISELYKKLAHYYVNSWIYTILGLTGQRFREYAASSGILGFFDREWNIESAWKRSRILEILIAPLRLFKYTSNKLSDGTNSVLRESKTLKGVNSFLEGLFIMNARVYGLLFVIFAATQGLLELVLGNGELLDMRGIVRLVLFLVGTMLILINRPVKYLVKGSMFGRIVYDFFTVRGLKNGTDDEI